MKRGETAEYWIGRVLIHVRRSSDGKWSYKGKPLSFIGVAFVRGTGRHRGKVLLRFWLSEYAFLIGTQFN